MFGTSSIPNRPTSKLVLAASGMCLMMFCSLARDFTGPSLWNTLFFLGSVIFGSWLSFLGVFRSPALHRLWGLGCLVVGVVICGVLLLAPLLGWEVVETTTRQDTLCLYLGTLGILLTGYLLVIDRDVVAYRHQFTLHFPNLDRLDPKADNVPHDPISPR
ncbi:MAG: hypothetical protein V4662_16785 [Verrucomicrobiota bacterium]